jgi:uncharacterized membrane protein YbhN (UPF0104 family)
MGAWFNRRSVRLCLVIAVMAALLWRIDRTQLRDILAHFDPLIGVVMLGVNFLLTAAFALRWWTIGRALGVAAPYRTFARAIWISQCLSELGPALVVGELARFRLLRPFGAGWPLALSQGLDRLSGKLVLLLIVGLLTPRYLAWYDDFPAGRIAVFVLLLGAGTLATVLMIRRFWRIARPHLETVIALCNPGTAPGHYLASFLIQALLAGNLALAALGLGVHEETAGRVFMLGPLVLLGVGVLPGLVSDWGKREALALVLLAPAGMSAEQSLAVSVVFGLVHLLAVLPAALLMLARRPPGPPDHDAG